MGIIANPNCVAATMTVAQAPLHAAHPIRRIQAATYQAASGAGAAYASGDGPLTRVRPQC